MTASTARAKAMSVAVGIAHPRRASPSPPSERDGGDEDQRGHDDAADGRDDRHHGLGRRAQVADEELALELQPRDEEEDREQAVAGPVPDGEVEVAPLDADHGVAHGEVGVGPRGVGQDQRGHRREQQRAADGLGAQRLGDVLRLGPARAVQDRAGRAGSGGGVIDALLRWDARTPGSPSGADQTSRRSAARLSAGGGGSRGGAAATSPAYIRPTSATSAASACTVPSSSIVFSKCRAAPSTTTMLIRSRVRRRACGRSALRSSRTRRTRPASRPTPRRGSRWRS